MCSPLPDWQFVLGHFYETRAVTGPWGSLSKVTGEFARGPITTQAETPLLNSNAQPVGNLELRGATTIELTNDEYEQSQSSGQLWVQGGTPADPVLASAFPGPKYGFGALRCATDAVNGDNVEYIFFPGGVKHVFCYALYVTPPPTSGTITIKKQVVGAPAGDSAEFPFRGDISYDPNGFTLRDGESVDYFRAGGSTWTVTEGRVDGYRLQSVKCTAVAPGGGPGTSTVDVTGATAAIHLVAKDHGTCTFTNRFIPPAAGLTIRKISLGGVGNFGYVVRRLGGPGAPRVAHATTEQPRVPVVAQPEPLRLRSGRYRISERLPSSDSGRWRMVGARCNGSNRRGGGSVEIQVSSGQAVVCTFVNVLVPRGSISISKVTKAGTGSAAFLVDRLFVAPAQYQQTATTTSEGEAAGATANSAADATDHLRLGRYAIEESAAPGQNPAGWALTSVRCNGKLVPFDQGAVHVKLTRAHPHVHCVFTNTYTPNPPPTPPPPPAPRPDGQLISDLVVTKAASVRLAQPGQTVRYRITVTNKGPNAAERVVVADQPPPGSTVISVHASAGSCQKGPPVICQLGTIQPGQKVTITVRMKLPTSGNGPSFLNRAVAGTATQESSLTNNLGTATITIPALRRALPRFTG